MYKVDLTDTRLPSTVAIAAPTTFHLSTKDDESRVKYYIYQVTDDNILPSLSSHILCDEALLKILLIIRKWYSKRYYLKDTTLYDPILSALAPTPGKMGSARIKYSSIVDTSPTTKSCPETEAGYPLGFIIVSLTETSGYERSSSDTRAQHFYRHKDKEYGCCKRYCSKHPSILCLTDKESICQIIYKHHYHTDDRRDDFTAFGTGAFLKISIFLLNYSFNR